MPTVHWFLWKIGVNPAAHLFARAHTKNQSVALQSIHFALGHFIEQYPSSLPQRFAQHIAPF